MSKFKDKIVQWQITIEGVDEKMKPILGGRAVITKEALLNADFPIREREFEMLWADVMKKSEEKAPPEKPKTIRSFTR